MTTRILLGAEYPIVRQELRALLEKEADFQVAAAVDTGEAAVQSARDVQPDVIVLDLAMFKGADPVHQLLAAVPTAKVIGLSMHADRRFVLEVLKAGASGYVLKEQAFEELVMAIRAVQAHKTYISHGLFDVVIQDYLELLRDSEGRFRSIFESFAIGIALMDAQGRIVESNAALQALLGYNQEELLHKELTEFLPPEEAATCKNCFNELAAGNPGPHLLEVEYRRKDGRLSWARLSISSFRGAGGAGQVAISLLEDINDRKQAEAKIHEYQDKLLSVARELSLAEETERRRLANGFHDDVGQLLALVQIKLGALRPAVAAGQVESLDEIRQILGQTIRSVRSLGGELSPPVLYELGFESAIEWLAEKLQEQHGIRFSVSADRSPKPLSDEVRVFLFHLIRDLLANLVKYAEPGNVTILLERANSNLKITIENDWSATAPLLTPDRPWIFSIRERLRYLGGNLEMEFGPGRITRISLLIP